jgi:membrane protease subunit HflK
MPTRFSGRSFPEEALMLTGDLNVADVKWIVQFRIADSRSKVWLNRRYGETETQRSRSAITPSIRADLSQDEVI